MCLVAGCFSVRTVAYHGDIPTEATRKARSAPDSGIAPPKRKHPDAHGIDDSQRPRVAANAPDREQKCAAVPGTVLKMGRMPAQVEQRIRPGPPVVKEAGEPRRPTAQWTFERAACMEMRFNLWKKPNDFSLCYGTFGISAMACSKEEKALRCATFSAGGDQAVSQSAHSSKAQQTER